MWSKNTFGRLFADPAFVNAIPPGTTAKGDITTVSGGTAWDWQDPSRLAILASELANNPTIDIVHISLSGNDFLSVYRASDTAAQRQAKWDAIVGYMRTIIEFTVAQRPNIRVAVCGYDYMNFWESVQKPYDPIVTQMYYNMGQPQPSQINAAMIELGSRLRALCDEIPRAYYVQSFGLMHFIYGYPGVVGPQVLPYPGQYPGYNPWPGGQPAWPNPPVAMNVVKKSTTNYVDPIHLSETGYFFLGWNCMTAFYVNWLNNPLPLDATPPVITLLGGNPVTVALGDVYADAGATAVDNIDGDITAKIAVVNSVNTSVLGTYVVTYNVTDAAGNAAAEVVRTVHVVPPPDTTPPVITLMGESEVTVTQGDPYVDAGATAYDGTDGDITSAIATFNSVDTSVVGTYTVIYTVSDAAGNAAAEVTRTVIVVLPPDTTPPVLSVLGDNPATIEVLSGYVDAGASAVDDRDGDLSSLIVSVSTVDANVLGAYTVTYDVVDAAGNRAQAVRTVSVVDTTPPVMSIIGETPAILEVHDPYDDAGATAADNYDGDLSASIVTASTVNVETVGEYTVTYTATDANGNTGQAVRTVSVVAFLPTAPWITLQGANPATVEVHTPYVDAGAVATDKHEGDISAQIVTVSNVDTSVVGSYTVTYNVTNAIDLSANEMVRTVNVVDTTPPAITLLGESAITLEIHSTYVDAGAIASDNYDGDLSAAIVANNTVDTGVLGAHMVTYNVKDAAGNAAAEVVRTVTIVDTTAPVLTLRGASPDYVNVGVAYVDPGAMATDNCDGDISARIVATDGVDTSKQGTRFVEYRVTDSSGNSATEMRRVRVLKSDAILKASSAALSFGTQAVSAGPGEPIALTITNTGNKLLQLLNSGITFGGDEHPDFSVVSIGIPAEGLAPGASADILVAFDPSATGPRQAQMMLHNTSGNDSAYQVLLSGIGALQLTTNIEGHGELRATPSGPHYQPGDEVTLEAVPDYGSEFVGWSGAVSGAEPTVTLTLDNDAEVTATFERVTVDLLLTTDGEGAIETDLEAPYRYGDVATLTAVPAEGWAFVAWTGALAGDANPCVLTLEKDVSAVTAQFALKEIALTLTANGEGVVKVNEPGPYYWGDVVTLTAVPATGWDFVQWSGDRTDSENPVQITVTENLDIAALFMRHAASLEVLTEGQGAVARSADGPYYVGDEVTLTALPETGWKFTGWSGTFTGTDNPAALLLSEDNSLTATFARESAELTVATSGSGTVEVNPPGEHYVGEEVILAATPGPGWTFEGWSGDLSGSANPVSLTLDTSKNVTAVFKSLGPQLNVVKVGQGTYSVSPPGPWTKGQVVKVSFYPSAGHQFITKPDVPTAPASDPYAGWAFDHWSYGTTTPQGGNPALANPAEITLNGDTTIYATFLNNGTAAHLTATQESQLMDIGRNIWSGWDAMTQTQANEMYVKAELALAEYRNTSEHWGQAATVWWSNFDRVPGGEVLDVCGEGMTWSGIHLTGLALKHSLMPDDQQTIDDITRVLNAMDRNSQIGGSGYAIRFSGPANDPSWQWYYSQYNGGNYQGAAPWSNYRYIGSTTRDVHTGYFMGLAAVLQYCGDVPALHDEAVAIAERIVDRLISDGWLLRDGKGQFEANNTILQQLQRRVAYKANPVKYASFASSISGYNLEIGTPYSLFSSDYWVAWMDWGRAFGITILETDPVKAAQFRAHIKSRYDGTYLHHNMFYVAVSNFFDPGTLPPWAKAQAQGLMLAYPDGIKWIRQIDLFQDARFTVRDGTYVNQAALPNQRAHYDFDPQRSAAIARDGQLNFSYQSTNFEMYTAYWMLRVAGVIPAPTK